MEALSGSLVHPGDVSVFESGFMRCSMKCGGDSESVDDVGAMCGWKRATLGSNVVLREVGGFEEEGTRSRTRSERLHA